MQGYKGGYEYEKDYCSFVYGMWIVRYWFIRMYKYESFKDDGQGNPTGIIYTGEFEWTDFQGFAED